MALLWKRVENLGRSKIMASHLQCFNRAAVINWQKWGEISSTTSLIIVQTSGY